MEKYNLALVLFTILTQASVGIILLRTFLIRLSTGPGGNYSFRKNTLLASLILLVFGLLLSFAHLSSPINSIYALNNLESSWMSREILADIILTTSLLIWYLTVKYRIKRFPLIIPEFLSVISGIILIFCMIKLYMLPSLPELNNPALPVSFIISTLLTPAIIMLLLLPKHNTDLYGRLLILTAIVFMASYLNYLIYYININSVFRFFSIHHITFLLTLISLIFVFAGRQYRYNKISVLIFMILAVLSDVLFRIFIISFTIPGF